MSEDKTLSLDNDHVYRIGTRTLPGVTGILQDNFGIQLYWSEWHANKGRAIHHAIHLRIQNKLDWSTVDSRIVGRINAFDLFMRETNYEIVKSEMPLFSKRHQFAGTLDLWLHDPVYNSKGKNIIIDIKPPSPEPIVELQLAAYALILKENAGITINRAAAVCLKDNGRYSLKWVPNLKRAEKIFLACLAVSNWQKENS